MSTQLVEVELEKIDLVMHILETYFETGEIDNLHEICKLLERDLNFPSGDETLFGVICHPYILFKYLDSISWRLRNNIGEERLTRRHAIYSQLKKNDGEECIRIRKFAPVGTYCGMPYVANDGYFFFWNDEPLLVTKYMKEQLWEQPLSFPLRQEVNRIAFCGHHEWLVQ